MSSLRLLIRPTLFTVGVCGTCFCTASIVQYENRRPKFAKPNEWIARFDPSSTISHNKYLQFRRHINAWKNSLSTGEKIAYGTIFANLVVLCAWRVSAFKPVMNKYFLSQISTSKIALSPMILSCFSHTMLLHFALNMYALKSFSGFATSLLGPEQLIGLYISAGAFSSLTSIAHRLLTKRTTPSLGASGALLGVVAYICTVRPDTPLLLMFIPVAAGNAIKALMAIDTIGIVARWRIMDHAAHLGGTLFGMWYAIYGEELYYKYRETVIGVWIRSKKRAE